MADTPPKDQRAERHLMRMRGAGPRAVASAFDFAFATVPRSNDENSDASGRASTVEHRTQHKQRPSKTTLSQSPSGHTCKPPLKRVKLERRLVDSVVSDPKLPDSKAIDVQSKRGKGAHSPSSGTKHCQGDSTVDNKPSKSSSNKRSSQVLTPALDHTRGASDNPTNNAVIRKDDLTTSASDRASSIVALQSRSSDSAPANHSDHGCGKSRRTTNLRSRQHGSDVPQVAPLASTNDHIAASKPSSRHRAHDTRTKNTTTKSLTTPVLKSSDTIRKTLANSDVDHKSVKSKSKNADDSQLRATTPVDDAHTDPLCSSIVALPCSSRTIMSVESMTRSKGAIGKDVERQKPIVSKTASSSDTDTKSRLSGWAAMNRKTVSKPVRRYHELAPPHDDIDLDDLITNIADLTKRSKPVRQVGLQT